MRHRRFPVTRVKQAIDSLGESGRQKSLIAAMMEPAFYPKPPDEVTHKETHISHLFFAGDLVYKVKKAVRYSFLDYSTLAARRHYLQEELRLNRRLAPSVYLGVVPISFDESAWRMGGWAEPREYTLVMRRLPEKRMLPFLLETGQVTPQMMRDAAQVLAAFHRGAEKIGGIDPSEYRAGIERQWRDNCAELGPWVGAGSERAALRTIERCGAEFIEAHKSLLMRRAAEGWIRDVHGDLHAEHVCFAPEGIQIFDCIEFSEALRRCDLALEIAFLTMDLSVRGGEALRLPFIARYVELVGDPDLPVVLPFFECHRALVRAKVHALRARAWNEEAVRYFAYARKFTWAGLKPFVVIVCGFSGSGKSTLARALGGRLGMAVINSDRVRKTLAAKTGRQAAPLNQGIYHARMTQRTYARMARDAEEQIRAREGAILDATFGRRVQREKIARLAGKYRVPLLVIRCSASDATTARRLGLRGATGSDLSDAGWGVYVAQKAAYEPMDEIKADRCLELDTDAPLEKLVDDCETFLRSRLV
jgi:uncharacterized protein